MTRERDCARVMIYFSKQLVEREKESDREERKKNTIDKITIRFAASESTEIKQNAPPDELYFGIFFNN